MGAVTPEPYRRLSPLRLGAAAVCVVGALQAPSTVRAGDVGLDTARVVSRYRPEKMRMVGQDVERTPKNKNVVLRDAVARLSQGGTKPIAPALPKSTSSVPASPATSKAVGQGASVTRIHVVAPGDTLWSIARRYGLTVAKVSAANNIADPSQLQVGQRLSMGAAAAVVPDASAAPGAIPATAPKASGLTKKPAVAAKKAKASPPPAKKLTPSSSKANRSKSKSKSNSKSKSKTKGYPLRWPVEGKITSRYGKRWGRAHDGIDLAAAQGTSVHAAAAGEVLHSGRHGSYGNLVVLKHADNLVTVYAHQQVNLVRAGQRVDAGQLIGRVGQTGRAAGPHLHFEVRRGATPANPLRLLPP